MRILITGGNGNLGRLVAQDLADRGHQLVCVDLPGSDGPYSDVFEDQYLGDVCDSTLLTQALTKKPIDGIIHLASLLSGSSAADPARAWAVKATV